MIFECINYRYGEFGNEYDLLVDVWLKVYVMYFIYVYCMVLS